MAKKTAKKKVASKPGRTGGGVVCACCPDWPIKYPERCSNTVVQGAKTYYFCTRRCKEKFLREPTKYA